MSDNITIKTHCGFVRICLFCSSYWLCPKKSHLLAQTALGWYSLSLPMFKSFVAFQMSLTVVGLATSTSHLLRFTLLCTFVMTTPSRALKLLLTYFPTGVGFLGQGWHLKKKKRGKIHHKYNSVSNHPFRYLLCLVDNLSLATVTQCSYDFHNVATKIFCVLNN